MTDGDVRRALIDAMAKAAFDVTNHYHESLQWHQAHPEMRDLMTRQATASLEAYERFAAGQVSTDP